MTSLEHTTELQIKQLCAEGYQHYDRGDFKAALRLFYQAWLQLPKPQSQWPQAGWILTALGDTYFRLGQFREGKEALLSARHCQNIDNNPFVSLRLGQCLLELGEQGKARKALTDAYTHGGSSLFNQEANKYRDVIADRVNS